MLRSNYGVALLQPPRRLLYRMLGELVIGRETLAMRHRRYSLYDVDSTSLQKEILPNSLCLQSPSGPYSRIRIAGTCGEVFYYGPELELNGCRLLFFAEHGDMPPGEMEGYSNIELCSAAVRKLSGTEHDHFDF